MEVNIIYSPAALAEKIVQFSNEKNAKVVYEKYEERNSQFEANIASHINEYHVVLESFFVYSLPVMSDHLSML